MELNCTVKELSELIDGSFSIDPSFEIGAITSFEHATSKDVAILFDPQEGSVFDDINSEVVSKSKAALIIASAPRIPERHYLIVKDPLQALEKIASIQFPNPPISESDIHVHSTASISSSATIGSQTIIDAKAVIDDETIIGKRCHIGAGAYIGKNCTLGDDIIIHPNVTILHSSRIGNKTIIHSGAVIGSDGFGYHINRKGLRKIPQIGNVRIGNNVEIGANTCIDRAIFAETIIEDHVKLDNQIHISHNVVIGTHTAIIAQTGIAGSTRIGKGCQIGGQVGIKDHLIIGNDVKIVSKTGVMKNINDGEIVAGVPAMPFNQWKRMSVALGQLPDLIKKVKPFMDSLNTTTKSWWKRFF